MIKLKKTYDRIVVKIGSSSLSSPKGIDENKIRKIVEQISLIKSMGKEIILVSSGAIVTGMAELNYKSKPYSLAEKQACAAVGQGILISIYNRIFRENNLKTAQVLLTAEDFSNRQRYMNAYNTIKTLLDLDVIPIVNENDTVATAEIKFGDNDMLSAQVAGLIEADLLIILSDVEGLLKDVNKSSSVINKVEEITPEVELIANGKSGKLGTGGMSSKIRAAKISIHSSIPAIIAPSYKENVILKALESIEKEKYDVGTTFLAKENNLSKRKRWIYYSLKSKGEIKIDPGAEKALISGKSLLAVGIKEILGKFNIGDLVKIVNENGEVIAKGLVNYSSQELRLMIRNKMLINESLGPEEVIHRNNMVLEEKIYP